MSTGKHACSLPRVWKGLRPQYLDMIKGGNWNRDELLTWVNQRLDPRVMEENASVTCIY